MAFQAPWNRCLADLSLQNFCVGQRKSRANTELGMPAGSCLRIWTISWPRPCADEDRLERVSCVLAPRDTSTGDGLRGE